MHQAAQRSFRVEEFSIFFTQLKTICRWIIPSPKCQNRPGMSPESNRAYQETWNSIFFHQFGLGRGVESREFGNTIQFAHVYRITTDDREYPITAPLRLVSREPQDLSNFLRMNSSLSPGATRTPYAFEFRVFLGLSAYGKWSIPFRRDKYLASDPILRNEFFSKVGRSSTELPYLSGDKKHPSLPYRIMKKDTQCRFLPALIIFLIAQLLSSSFSKFITTELGLGRQELRTLVAKTSGSSRVQCILLLLWRGYFAKCINGTGVHTLGRLRSE